MDTGLRTKGTEVLIGDTVVLFLLSRTVFHILALIFYSFIFLTLIVYGIFWFVLFCFTMLS